MSQPLNHDIIREILLWASLADSDFQSPSEWPEIEGYESAESKDIVKKHFTYLAEKDWIDVDYSNEGTFIISGIHLLPPGWDHLDSIKDDSLWTRLKKAATDRGMSLSFDLIKAGVTTAAKVSMESALK